MDDSFRHWLRSTAAQPRVILEVEMHHPALAATRKPRSNIDVDQSARVHEPLGGAEAATDMPTARSLDEALDPCLEAVLVACEDEASGG